MDFKTFSDKTDLCSQTEIEKVKLLATYLSQYEDKKEFSLSEILYMLESLGCKVSNVTRLRQKLTKDRTFKKSKDNCWILNPKTTQKYIENYKEQLEDNTYIISDSELLEEAKFSGKRGYLDKLISQANNCYHNNCYDACAVMLRRIFEILLILSYRNNNIESEIQDSSGQTYMLERIVANAISNKTLKLSSRNLLNEYTSIRNIGNYAAHKIEYNTTIKDIDDIKTIYRVRLEELYHKAGLL